MPWTSPTTATAVVLEARATSSRSRRGRARPATCRTPPGRGKCTPPSRRTAGRSPSFRTAPAITSSTPSPSAGGEWTALTTGLDRLVYHLAWSPDGAKILFGNKDFAVFYVDVATKKLVKVDASNQMKNDEFFWEVSDYGWSPDGNWICYSLVQANRNSRIFLYSLADGRKVPVTDDFYDNINPCFDAGGDYLYFLSSRNFDVQMDFYEDNHVISAPQQVMAVQLRAGEAPPFGDAPAPAEAGKLRTNEGRARPFRIDVDGLAQRTSPLPGEPGNFFFLRAGKGMAVWCSVDRFTDDEYEEIFKPRGRDEVDPPYLRCGARRRRRSSGIRSASSGFRRTESGPFIRKDNDIFVTTLDRGLQDQGARREARPPGTDLCRRPAGRVGADLHRRLALVPRFLL